MDPAALQFIGHFGRHLLTERRLSPHTQSAYALDLAALVAFCDRAAIQRWDELKAPDVRTFAAREHARGHSGVSIRRRLAAIRCFFNFLIREAALGVNPALDIKAPKVGRHLPNVLDVDQVTQLLDIAQYRDHDPHAIRDKAIMELLYSSALRVTELVRLDCADLDLASGQVHVLGKGSKERIVPVGSYALAAVRAWLPIREQIVKAREPSPALFVGRYGRRLSQRNVQLRIAHWAKVRGIPIHVHPHVFRHSCATHLLEGAGDIRYVQEFLGHASISTTQIYTHLDFAHIARAYDAAHPRSGMDPAERAKRLPPEEPPPRRARVSNVSPSLNASVAPRDTSAGLGASPCDDCPRAARCGAEHLACSAFEAFYEGVPEAQWRALPRADATAERYQRLSET